MLRKFRSNIFSKYARRCTQSSSSQSRTVLSFGSGVLGHLADSSVIARHGDSVVHVAITSKRADDPKDAFLPLTVEYRDRTYAHGRIPHSINRREGKSSDEEILISRVVDRAIRPLFPKGYVDELQVTLTTHAVDGVNDPTILSVNAASCALLLSNQPWNGPLGCVRIGLVGGMLKVNPTLAELEQSQLDLVYAGTSKRPLMYGPYLSFFFFVLFCFLFF